MSVVGGVEVRAAGEGLGIPRPAGCALPPRFYELNTVLLEALLRTLAASPGPRVRPGSAPPPWDGCLGLDRAQEVKTTRRKVASFAATGRAGDLAEFHYEPRRATIAVRTGEPGPEYSSGCRPLRSR